MAKQNTKKFKKPTGKSHLDKEFLTDLKHKMWATKGTRFQAAERLKTKSRYSALSISLLSAYLIIFGLLSVYNLYSDQNIPPNLIPFSITTVSIFLLVFTLFENAKNYDVRAIHFHNCGLKIARLHNAITNYKSYRESDTDEKKLAFCVEMQDKYQTILERYENHLQIDNKIFKTNHTDYYDYIKWDYIVYVKMQEWLELYFFFILITVGPAVLLAYMIKSFF
jgi:hypothetical protein